MAIGLLLISAAVALCVIVHTAGMAVFGLLLKMEIEEISVFAGPRLVSARIAGVPLSVGLLPISGYVKLESASFEQQGHWKRILVMLAGCMFLLVLSAAVLGASRSWELLLTGFQQAVTGALSPFGHGATLVGAAAEFARQNSFVVLLGVVSVKMVALQLFPIPPLNGGHVVIMAADAVYPLQESTQLRITVVGLFVILLLYLSWAVAVVAAFF